MFATLVASMKMAADLALSIMQTMEQNQLMKYQLLTKTMEDE